MRKIFISFLFICFVLFAESQVKDRIYATHIYLGAPKAALIEVAIDAAKEKYRTNANKIIDVQRKAGLNLRNKKKLEEFLVTMEADMRTQLTKFDAWQDWDSWNDYDPANRPGIDFRKYKLSIKLLVGKGFRLPGFETVAINRTNDLSVSLTFKNQKVNYIYTNVSVSWALDAKQLVYNDGLLKALDQTIRDSYAANATWTTKNYQTDWMGLSDYRYQAVRINYKMEDQRSKIEFGFDFKPFGEETGPSRQRYIGTSLQDISFTAILK